jgi:hypothetical protein
MANIPIYEDILERLKNNKYDGYKALKDDIIKDSQVKGR